MWLESAERVDDSTDMLPPKQLVPTMKATSIYVAIDVLFRAEAIAKAENESRNRLLGSFLAFAVDLYPRLKALQAQIEAFQKQEEVSYAEAVAVLVKRGLRVK